MKRMIAMTLLALLAAPVAMQAQTPAQNSAPTPTLADIARQKRAEKSARKVYTSEDMKAAVDEPSPAVEGADATKEGAAGESSVKANEAIAAAEAKVEDLKLHEAFYNRNIARFQTSAEEATAAGDQGKLRIMTESLESARTELAKTTEDRAKAEAELEQIKTAQAAAAAAAAAKKKPARKAAPKPKA